MTAASRNPIFIHSLFRSGSTYVFHAFRRAKDATGAPVFTAFQEPIHEAVIDNAENPKALEAFYGAGEIPRTLRHPEIGESYFAEIVSVWPAWKDTANASIVYEDYFLSAKDQAAIGFLHSLIEAAPQRPVIQDCRTASRIAPIKGALGGVHAYLWRNPWDQWWSLKATDYFETAHQVIATSAHAPSPVRRLAAELGLPLHPGFSIAQKFEYFYDHPLSTENSYAIFYLLWLLALKEGADHADISLNIDRLSESDAYRQEILTSFGPGVAEQVNFSDASVPRARYNEQDKAFFKAIELKIHSLLLQSEWSEEAIQRLTEVRLANAPQTVDERGEGRLRAVMRRAQSRDAHILQARAEALSAAAREAEHLRLATTGFPAAIENAVTAVRAEAADNRIRLDALLSTTRAERDTALQSAAATQEALAAERAESAKAKESAAAYADRIEALLAVTQQERDAALQSAAGLQEANAALEARSQTLSADLKAATARAQSLEAALGLADTEARQEKAMLVNQVATLSNKLFAVMAEATHSRTRLEAMLSSTSWKITTPLRKTKTALTIARREPRLFFN
ncbi:MAG: hypothetical protein U5J99_05485 [Parvularculaceae bacterium]|nr:hypothetical protein [Parvularculaceae bacterium]